MASFTTAWLLPTRVFQNDSVGTTAWVETSKLLVDDGFNECFSIYQAGSEAPYVSDMRLVFNDALATAEDKGVNEYTFTMTESFGGASDDWSENLTGADINNEKFGFAFTLGTADSGPVYSGAESYYLVATGFEYLYNIPDNAVIAGIEVNLDGNLESTGGGTQTYKLDTVKIRVTFTWDIEVLGNASSFGGIYIDPPNRQLPAKKYRYKVRSENGDYLGDWKDVASKPKFKKQINNVIGSMAVTLGRNDRSTEQAVTVLLNENDVPITNEDDSTLLLDTAPVIGLGSGTTLDTNNEVEVDAIYGQFEALLNEDDSPILNEDGSMILVEEGYPLGRTIFRGYVPRWELPLDGGAITTEIRSFSQDLANIILETEDIPYVDTGLPVMTSPYGGVGIAGGGPTDYETLYQSFTIGVTKTLSKIRLVALAGWYFDIDFNVQIYGGSPSAYGTNYGGGSAFANRNEPKPYIDVVFDSPITLTAGTYFFELSTSQYKTGGNETYPINFAFASVAYGGGSYWYYNNATGLVNDTGKDIAFTLYEAGGDTSVPFLSKDPSQILRSIVDFANSRGAKINYTPDSIEVTETLVSYTFNTNTIKEAIDKVLELCPSGWYYYYDFGTDTIYLKKVSTTPDRYLRQGQNVAEGGKIVKTIEQVVNDVLFSGGGSPTNLFKRTRITPIAGTRRGLSKKSDNRVTDSSTATILSQSDIDQFKSPLYAGDVPIVEDEQNTFYLEDVNVGELIGFVGFGHIVDAIEVQSVSTEYNPDVMPTELTYDVPTVNKRVEDIKRNLEVVEQKNNPAEPS